MTIVGVDLSSKQINLAWLDENGKPQRWHQALEGKHLIDRLRSIQITWPGDAGRGWETTEVAIEKPFSQSRRSTAALSAVVGIVTRQAPPWARVAWPSSGELRAAIGAKNNKADAHEAIVYGVGEYPWQVTPYELHHWDEHELDALVACIGWQKILESQDDAWPQ